MARILQQVTYLNYFGPGPMPTYTIWKTRNLLAPVLLGLLAGCSHLNASYQYDHPSASARALHSVLADHDHDGVRDFGDLCRASHQNRRVDTLGCSTSQYSTLTSRPLAHIQSCTQSGHPH